jgi:hypothetical protein
MNCEQYEAALSEYIDGTLQASDDPLDVTRLDALEAHLPGCARCRAIVEDLHTLRDAARTLEPHVPPAHVWTRIAGAVESRGQRGWYEALTWQPLATAAALLLVLAGGSWFAWQQIAPPATAPIAARPATGPAPDPELVQDVETQLKLAEEHYVKAIAGLEAITKAEGSELDPQTAEVLQANLTVIDQAIGESRAALRTEPASDLAQQSLFDALRTKVTLLQDTIALINEMRKGNQEGAARIVSGLNQ